MRAVCVVYFDNEDERERGQIVETLEKLYVVMADIKRREHIDKYEIKQMYSDLKRMWKK